jgi:hypothetical protein
MNQSRSGHAGRGFVADLEPPLPDIRLAGGGNAEFHVPVDHDLSRVGPNRKQAIFCPGNQSG